MHQSHAHFHHFAAHHHLIGIFIFHGFHHHLIGHRHHQMRRIGHHGHFFVTALLVHFLGIFHHLHHFFHISHLFV
ncbi:hypothetical protein COW36_13925 [bacterium (Candidatus Blackallbacteria) CG17_big_fil_post_rev_8_21_14_2_50_48_46]|uniref:Uncharacterized protein n=1 Tax=bacterium (Candidatus Blackallbacteria) CG17_big_fil_post_rev_8_21_14_2_50_48_46 TaxID=2014261 RepID=A0A2M7G317_9BACT|nr:MAG: hypothetical protein COW36_13925 [bacterium (Candidatus Blackallbacteria) CG17_big_fil_post_rev_8_21_14_2_50_48_46]PIW49892.1 MAG: hypothetical protein COW20_04380 [bacterium (Candidatus Blackallbacteria) CG13_big_fil_rev_8_21_14_2_50_49_14]